MLEMLVPASALCILYGRPRPLVYGRKERRAVFLGLSPHILNLFSLLRNFDSACDGMRMGLLLWFSGEDFPPFASASCSFI
jgi:hypothetical protein